MDRKLEQAKAHAKQAVGKLTGDEELEKAGKADEVASKAKEAVEKAADELDDVVEKVKEKIKKD